MQFKKGEYRMRNAANVMNWGRKDTGISPEAKDLAARFLENQKAPSATPVVRPDPTPRKQAKLHIVKEKLVSAPEVASAEEAKPAEKKSPRPRAAAPAPALLSKEKFMGVSKAEVKRLAEKFFPSPNEKYIWWFTEKERAENFKMIPKRGILVEIKKMLFNFRSVPEGGFVSHGTRTIIPSHDAPSRCNGIVIDLQHKNLFEELEVYGTFTSLRS